MARKSNIQLTAILYIHQGINLTEACRLTKTHHDYGEKVRSKDEWDAFTQELAQLTRPSNLTLVKALDFDTIKTEQIRREKTLPALKTQEEKIIDALKAADAGSREEGQMLGNLKKLRDLISEVTGFEDYKKEMSAARQAALVSIAKEAPGSSAPTSQKVKGKVLDI